MRFLEVLEQLRERETVDVKHSPHMLKEVRALSVAFLIMLQAVYACGNKETLSPGNSLATVSGSVKCCGRPVAGVVVSDGFETCLTDSEGCYSFQSGKRHGYVFISIPSGYKVELTNGILPQFAKQFQRPSGTDESVDFTLQEEKDQKNHIMLVFGDIHLADRTDDRNQFARFTSEINQYIKNHPQVHVYAIALGDMTEDLYWYSRNYSFPEYIKDMSAVGYLPIFHTIGNHDHDMLYAGDWQTAVKFKQYLCPTYYSFNIGDVHYMVLDNIECTNTSGGTPSDRHYLINVTDYQLRWIKKDLSYVDSMTPVIVALHANVKTDSNTNCMMNADALWDCFKGHPYTQFYTGHSHVQWNLKNEHNAGAVCACWWWCGYYTPSLNIGSDGSPGGYKILEVNGKEISQSFKGTGRPASEVFRSYDRNCIEITAEKFAPDANENSADKLKEAAGEYSQKNKENQVLVNIWNWDDDWTVSVTEDGRELKVERVRLNDPLFIIAYTAKRLNSNDAISYNPSETYHMFKAVASRPDCTLEIKVTDSQGVTYTESMTRPKAFSLENYK